MKVLVVYYYRDQPMRLWEHNHLQCFARYGAHEVSYLNLHEATDVAAVFEQSYDVIVFHTLFLARRWVPEQFARLVEQVLPLAQHAAVKVALPQDEFYRTDDVCAFIRALGVRHVFAVSPQSEWPKIYSSLDPNRVAITRVLNGYLDDSWVRSIAQRSQNLDRSLQVAYRAWQAEAWLGKHGQLKVEVARRVEPLAKSLGLSVDISTEKSATLTASDWESFLLSSQYTLGVEGGASLHDHDGSLREQVTAFTASHPQASFQDIEATCFLGRDGEFAHFVNTPRHLEACATRTCQVLVEGTYNGILQPHVHYIPIKSDFSNLEDVLGCIKQDDLRQDLVQRAYRDVVKSQKYSYASFVKTVFASL